MRFLIMGAPGAGKGTQAANIVKHYNIPHISTGDMFREAIKNQTEMGMLAKTFMDKGELVPDEVTIGIVRDRLNQDDAKKGFLLDGFPRNLDQAVALDKILADQKVELDNVINIVVDDEKIITRIIGRRVCKTCGATYHVTFNKPNKEGICDVCGSELIQRKDDTEDTARNRLVVYRAQTEPLLNYYGKQNLVFNVNGDQSLDSVFSEILKNLGE